MVKKIKKVSREVVRDKDEDVVRKSKATRKKDRCFQYEQKFQERQRRTRALGSRLTQSRLFLGMLVASFRSKQPIVHFQVWLQKALKEHVKQQEESRANSQT